VFSVLYYSPIILFKKYDSLTDAFEAAHQILLAQRAVPLIPCAIAAPEGQYLCSNGFKPDVPGPAGRYLKRNDAGAGGSGNLSVKQDTGPMGRETVFVCKTTKILPLWGSDRTWNYGAG